MPYSLGDLSKKSTVDQAVKFFQSCSTFNEVDIIEFLNKLVNEKNQVLAIVIEAYLKYPKDDGTQLFHVNVVKELLSSLSKIKRVSFDKIIYIQENPQRLDFLL